VRCSRQVLAGLVLVPFVAIERAFWRRTVQAKNAAEQLAYSDSLTTIANRRKFDHDLDETLSARFGNDAIAVAMFDVDHFKEYNDANGHIAGDEALKVIAQLISTNVRCDDLVYRYGGEEFAALLVGASEEDASMVAERVRAAIAAHDFPGASTQPGGRITVSAGVAMTPPERAADMMRAADQALYTAKASGRNQVSIAR
jgi:diguanylate cyclase (GGDEF)-like protein